MEASPSEMHGGLQLWQQTCLGVLFCCAPLPPQFGTFLVVLALAQPVAASWLQTHANTEHTHTPDGHLGLGGFLSADHCYTLTIKKAL